MVSKQSYEMFVHHEHIDKAQMIKLHHLVAVIIIFITEILASHCLLQERITFPIFNHLVHIGAGFENFNDFLFLRIY